MEKYKSIDSKIMVGYSHLDKDESTKVCDFWLDAWEDIKVVMKEESIPDITSLQKKHAWTDFLSNFVQDLEQELYNAGLDDEAYFSKRIQYCEEMLQLCGDDDELIIENTRRAIADSYYALGNAAECDRLYSMWLTEDPTWGWGYIGWADCYSFGTRQIKANYERAEEIISRALEQKDVKDREEILMRAREIYGALGQTEKAEELKREWMTLNRTQGWRTVLNTLAKAVKVGRNEPCPCGSGKKYKKCCGK